MIRERTVVGQILVDEFFNISVRTDTILERDGSELTRKYHRVALPPGADTSGLPPHVRAIAAAAWTPEVVAAAQTGQPALGRS